MTIKTLTYIHNLLKEDVNTHENAKAYIRECYFKAQDEDRPNVECLRKQYETARDKLREAQNALEDFESKEW